MRPLNAQDFERLVSAALDDLPREIATRMDNVELFIEDVPDDETAEISDTDPTRLLGLYQGIPLTERGNDYFGVLPDRITLYKRNIERTCSNSAQVKEAVKRTVIHEIAHHFGIDDERLEELGWD